MAAKRTNKLKKLPPTTTNPRRAAVWWIEWADSTIAGRWMTASDAVADRDKATRIYSVGILLANDELGIVLAGGAHGSDVSGVLTIPRGAVLKAKRLR